MDEKDIKILAENQSKTTLNEGMLSWAGKLFFASIASYLADVGNVAPPKLPFKLRGTQEEINAVISMILTSKKFIEALKKPGANVEDVINKLNLKNITAEKFELLTGKKWPLG